MASTLQFKMFDGVEGGATADLVQPMPTRDNVYYFQVVIFQVGNTLFRVPKSAFNVPGTTFEAMFALPPTSDADGSTDENPIVLDVDETEFRGFLRIVCGSRIQKVTNEDWLHALDLATMWTFAHVRREAILVLDEWVKSQSLKQVILTAKKYSIVTWLKAAYTQLLFDQNVTQPFLNLANHPAVDWETIARLLHIKNLHLSNRYTVSTCGKCRNGRLCCGTVDPMVEETFKAEFERMKETSPKSPLYQNSTRACGVLPLSHRENLLRPSLSGSGKEYFGHCIPIKLRS